MTSKVDFTKKVRRSMRNLQNECSKNHLLLSEAVTKIRRVNLKIRRVNLNILMAGLIIMGLWQIYTGGTEYDSS
jgi:uncharacterized membrane protein